MCDEKNDSVNHEPTPPEELNNPKDAPPQQELIDEWLRFRAIAEAQQSLLDQLCELVVKRWREECEQKIKRGDRDDLT